MEYERLAWLALLAATWVAVIVGMYLVVGRKHDAALLARKEREAEGAGVLGPHYRHETSAVVSTHAIDALAILDWMHDAKDVPQPIQDAVWRCIEELRRHDKALPIEHPIGDWDAPPKVSMGPGHNFPIFTASVPQKPDG